VVAHIAFICGARFSPGGSFHERTVSAVHVGLRGGRKKRNRPKEFATANEQSFTMRIDLPDDADFDDMVRGYFRELRRRGLKTAIALARHSKLHRTTIYRMLKRFGWSRKDARPEGKRAAPSPKPASRPAVSRDFLTPNIRAKLEAYRRKKKKP
jgi:hypothetical protein